MKKEIKAILLLIVLLPFTTSAITWDEDMRIGGKKTMKNSLIFAACAFSSGVFFRSVTRKLEQYKNDDDINAHPTQYRLLTTVQPILDGMNSGCSWVWPKMLLFGATTWTIGQLAQYNKKTI